MESPRLLAAMGISSPKEYGGAWWDQRSSREKLFSKIKPKMFGAKFVTSPEKSVKPLVSAVQDKFNDPKFMPQTQMQLVPKSSIVSILSETGLMDPISKKKDKREREDEMETSVTSSMSSVIITEMTETLYKSRKIIGKTTKDEIPPDESLNNPYESEGKSEPSELTSELTVEQDMEFDKYFKGGNTRVSPNNQRKEKRQDISASLKRKLVEETDDTMEYPKDIKNEKKMKTKWKAEMEMLMAKQSTNQTREDILGQKDLTLKSKQKDTKVLKDDEELSETTTESQHFYKKRLKQPEVGVKEFNHKLHRSEKFHGLLMKEEEEDDDIESLLKRLPKFKNKYLKYAEEEETEVDDVEINVEEKSREKRARQVVAEELTDPKYVSISKVQKQKPKVVVRGPSPESNDVEPEEEVEEELTASTAEFLDKQKGKGYAKKVLSRAPTPYYHHEDNLADDDEEEGNKQKEPKKKSKKNKAEVQPDEEFLNMYEEANSKQHSKNKKKALAATTPFQSRELHMPEEPDKKGWKRIQVNAQGAYSAEEMNLGSSRNRPAGRRHALEREHDTEQMASREKKQHKMKQCATALLTTDQPATASLKEKRKMDVDKCKRFAPGMAYDDQEQLSKAKKKNRKTQELDKEESEVVDVSPQSLSGKKKSKIAAPHEENLQNAVAALLSAPQKHKSKQKEGTTLYASKKELDNKIEKDSVMIPDIIMKRMKELLSEELNKAGKSGNTLNASEKILKKYHGELVKLMNQGSSKHLFTDRTEIQKYKHLSADTNEDANVTETEESWHPSRASTSSVTSVASSSRKSPVARVEHRRKHRTLEITLHVATLSSINQESEEHRRSRKRRSNISTSEKDTIDNIRVPMLPFVKLSESPPSISTPPNSNQDQSSKVVRSKHFESLHGNAHSQNRPSKRGDGSSKPVHAQLSVKSVLDHIPDLIPAGAELTTAEEEDIRYIVSQIISTQLSNGDLTADSPSVTPEEAKMQAENVQSLISQILSPKNSRGDSPNPKSPVADGMQDSETIIRAITEQSSLNNYNIDAVLRSVAAILAKQDELMKRTKAAEKKKVDKKPRDKKKFEKMTNAQQEPESEEESSKFSVSEVAIANDSELLDNSDALDDLATIADDVSMGSSNEESFVPPGEETVTEEPTMISESRSVSVVKGSSGTEWSQSDFNSGEDLSLKPHGKSRQGPESGETSDGSLLPSSTNLQSEASVETFSQRRALGECNTIEEEEEESESDSDEESVHNDRRMSKGAKSVKGSLVDNYVKVRLPASAQKVPVSHSPQRRGQQNVSSKMLPLKAEDTSSSESDSID